jgi:hypothetical protein
MPRSLVVQCHGTVPKLVEANEAPKLGWAAETDPTGGRDGIKAEDDPTFDEANEAPKLGWAAETDPSAMPNGKVYKLGCAVMPDGKVPKLDSAAMTDSTAMPDGKANDTPKLACSLAMLDGVKEWCLRWFHLCFLYLYEDRLCKGIFF